MKKLHGGVVVLLPPKMAVNKQSKLPKTSEEDWKREPIFYFRILRSIIVVFILYAFKWLYSVGTLYPVLTIYIKLTFCSTYKLTLTSIDYTLPQSTNRSGTSYKNQVLA